MLGSEWRVCLKKIDVCCAEERDTEGKKKDLRTEEIRGAMWDNIQKYIPGAKKKNTLKEKHIRVTYGDAPKLYFTLKALKGTKERQPHPLHTNSVTVDMWQAEKGQCWERSLLWPNTLWQLGLRFRTRAMLIFHLTIFKPSFDSSECLCGPELKYKDQKKEKNVLVTSRFCSLLAGGFILSICRSKKWEKL